MHLALEIQVGQIFSRSDFLLLILFFSIFILSMISFCFFLRQVYYLAGNMYVREDVNNVLLCVILTY